MDKQNTTQKIGMELPKQKSEINLEFKNQKIGMIGASGIGKSAFFAEEENAFFLDLEGGLNFLKVNKLPARSWNDIREIYVLLKQAEQAGKFPYSLIVFDTIDKVVDYAEEEIIQRAKEYYTKIATEINTIGDVPNGGGWAKTRNIVENLLDKFKGFPCAIAYIGHLQTKKIDEGVRKYDRHTIAAWAGMAQDLLAWPDHLLHIEATLIGDRLKRTVWAKPTQSKECKSRGGIVPDGWQWEDSMAENYRKFRELFV